jgi:hypothetical protein
VSAVYDGPVERRTWTVTDKAAWGPGPWRDEPDKEQFTDEATGLPCLIVRNSVGALCGYVGVGEGHPWFGKDPGDLETRTAFEVDYADLCQEGPEAETICHVPAPGEPDRVWWLGFHCSHAWDISPGIEAREESLHGWGPVRLAGASYKTAACVKVLCAVLAADAVAAARSSRRALDRAQGAGNCAGGPIRGL